MKTYLIAFILFVSLMNAKNISAQSIDSQKAKDELVKILNRNARFPLDLAEKKISAVFSLKIILSAGNNVVKVLPSKYFPEKMITQLANPAIFKDVSWEAIFNRKLRDGDAVIIPFIAYNSMENNATFTEYTMEDLFSYSGSKEPFVNGAVMQTYVIAYGNAVK